MAQLGFPYAPPELPEEAPWLSAQEDEEAGDADMTAWLGSLFDEPEADEFTAWYDAQFDEGGLYDRPGWEESRPSIQ